MTALYPAVVVDVGTMLLFVVIVIHTVRLPSPSEFGKRHHFITQHDLASATSTPLRPYSNRITVIGFAFKSPHSIILTLDTYRSISMPRRDWHRTM
jgi:hypothetical protein